MSAPTCPQCQTEVQPDWDWCQACGFDPEGLRPVESLPAPPSSPPLRPAPPRPPTIAEAFAPKPAASPQPLPTMEAFGPPPGSPNPGGSVPRPSTPSVPVSPPFGGPGPHPSGGPGPYPASGFGFAVPSGYGVLPTAAPAQKHTALKIVAGVLVAGLALVIVLVLAVTFLGRSVDKSSSSAAPSSWVTYSPPDGSFTASFPNTPKGSTQTQMSSDGIPIAFDLYSAGTQIDALTIATAKIPPGGTFSPKLAAEGEAASVGGTAIASTPTTFAGNDALDFKISIPAGTVQATVVKAGSRLYLIQYGGETLDPKVWEQFRGSVTLTP